MFYEIINSIKIGYKHNTLYSKINLKKNDFQIINIMIKLGILKRLVKIKNNNYIIYYNYVGNNNCKVFYNIKNMYRPSHKKFIKLADLKKAVLIKRSILILSTNIGIITSFEAVKLQKGGLIIAKI